MEIRLRRIIAEHPFFADLEPITLNLLVSCASNVRFQSRQATSSRRAKRPTSST